MNEKLILDYNQKPEKAGLWLLLSLQHVFAMFSATVLVPLLTGLPISVALFASGCGTLIYILCTKGKVPIYLGSSFAYIVYINSATLAAGGSFGPALTGLLVVGAIYVIVALVIHFVGSKWLQKLLSPVVVGTMIIIIGLSLAGSAVTNAGIVEKGLWKNIVVAFATLLILAFVAIKGKGFIRIVPFLIAIIAGYLLALALNWIGPEESRLFDFTELVRVAKSPAEWFGLPKFIILGWKDQELAMGMSMVKINFAAALTVIPLAFATISEHIGDHQVLGGITGKNYLADPGLDRTLLGDGVATAFAAILGGPANTSYGENTSVVGLTKIGSVWVTGGAAVIAILLSFCNIFTTFIATIPGCVMGGVCLILYGFIAANGLKVMQEKNVNLQSTKNLIIISVMLVTALGGAAISITQNASLNGVALAMILGILLNVILPDDQPKEKVEEPHEE